MKQSRPRSYPGNDKNPIRVLLVDDSPHFIGAAARLFEGTPGFKLVGTSGSVGDALATIDDARPDVVVMDLVLHGLTGLDGARMIKKQSASTRVVITSLQDAPEYYISAKMAGAEGFFTKGDFCDKLLPFIKKICDPNHSF
jgi:DNA-binding NarL/FixJ family response regulator